MNTSKTMITILLTVIVTTLVLGSAFIMISQVSTNTNSSKEKVVLKDDTIAVPDTRYAVGQTVVISRINGIKNCGEYQSDCDKILVTTEVEVTQPSTDKSVTGKFYIREYLGGDEVTGMKIAEKQITQNYCAFCGDGGMDRNYPEWMDENGNDTERIMTITSPFDQKFFVANQKLTLLNEGDISQFNEREVSLYGYGDPGISFPQ